MPGSLALIRAQWFEYLENGCPDIDRDQIVTIAANDISQPRSQSFIQIPTLENVVTFDKIQDQLGASYYFTFNFPDGAEASLERLDFILKQGVNFPRFAKTQSTAFEGTVRNRGQEFPVQSVQIDRSRRTVSMIFSPAIQPGRTFTVELKVIQNPTQGTYLYEVRGHAASEALESSPSPGQYFGLGRLEIRPKGIGR